MPWALSRVLAVSVLLSFVPHRGQSRWWALVMRWDGAHYFAIARDGYGALDAPWVHWPFAPGLPLLISALEVVGRADVLAFAVNQVLLLVALVGLHQLALRRATPHGAALAVWALAFFPWSFVFSMTYPSALYLAASVWAFKLAEDRLDVFAGLLAAVAAVARPNGFIVALALLFAVRAPRARVAVCAPTLVAVGAWCAYCWHQTGDAFAFVSAKANWDEITIWRVFTDPRDLPTDLVPHCLLAIAAICLVVWQRRSLPRAWVVLTMLSLLPSLGLGMQGLARYANECFPPFVAIGQVLERHTARFQAAAIASSGLAMLLLATTVTRYRFVP